MKDRLVGDAKVHGDFSIENLREQKMEPSISRILWDPTSLTELRMCSSEDFINFATQVANHERLFPFSDHLTTLRQ